MANVKRLSILVKRFLPPHIYETYPQFALFIQKYFEFLEQQYGEYDIIANFLKYKDVDTRDPNFLEGLKQVYLNYLPAEFKTAEMLPMMIKNIREFYKSKGTEAAFSFLFYTMFQEKVDFYYPRVDIFRASDGRWYKPQYLIVKDVGDNYPPVGVNLYPYEGLEIRGKTSDTVAYIDDIVSRDYLAVQTLQFLITNISGVFADDEELEIITTQYDTDLVDPSVQLFVETHVTSDPSLSATNGYTWKTTDSFASSDKKIQDSFFYQDFSYQIQSSLTLDEYKEMFDLTVNPAGYLLFNEFTGILDIEGDLELFASAADFWIRLLLEFLSSEDTLDAVSYDGTEAAGFFIEKLHEYIFTGISYAPTYKYVEEHREDSYDNLLFQTIGTFDSAIIGDFEDNPDKFFIWSDDAYSAKLVDVSDSLLVKIDPETSSVSIT